MTTIVVNISWPDTLSLPFIGYAGSPRYATVVTPADSAVSQRRSRFSRSYSNLKVSWNFTVAEYDAFQAFFLDTLGNGAARFKIQLRYPKNTDLEEWMVGFGGGYESSWINGLWRVDAELDLVMPTVIPEAAPEEGSTPFFVASDNSSDGEQEFRTSEDRPFTVKI
jgi:hypothetical protein